MARLVEYKVCLSEEERNYLYKNTISGKWPPRKVRKAHILLKADTSAQNHMSEEKIAEEIQCSLSTVKNTKLRFAKGERLKAIDDRPRCGRPRMADGEIEAHIVATVCSSAPEGRTRWTLKLIADKVMVLTSIQSCSRSTVCRALKK